MICFSKAFTSLPAVVLPLLSSPAVLMMPLLPEVVGGPGGHGGDGQL